MEIRTLGRYQLLERLGQGGMGVVYRAFDPQIERTVAIKMISAQLVDQPEHRERFFREARAAGKLAHPNIITIFDLGEDNGQPYIAMEYVEGQSLEARIRRGPPLSLAQKCAVVAEISDALSFAHTAGIVHRDMKPANVMLTRTGGVRILDFGLARLVTSELTRSNIVVGTINYMAPEQIRAEAIDHRADIFSVGVLFFELLSGHKAFEADSFAATMFKVLQERPAAYDGFGTEAPFELAVIIERAIEKDPNRRYQSMGDMLRDLEHIRSGLPPPEPILVPDDVASPFLGSAPLVSGPELETTFDARSVTAPVRTALAPATHVRPASGRPVDTRMATGHTPAPAGGPTTAGVPSTAPLSTTEGRSSRLVPIVSALALVVIAVAVVIFVLRSPALRPTAVNDGPQRDAAAAPQTPAPSPQPGAAPPVPAQRPVAVSATDDLTQQTESARALYRAGRYGEAAAAAGRVLSKSPGNAEAKQLMADLTRYARQAASEAIAGMEGSRARAESAGAPATAAATFSRATRSARQARALFAAGDYGKATSTGYAAQGLFDAAASEASSRAADRETVTESGAASPAQAPAVTSSPPRETPMPTVEPIPAPAAVPPPPAPAAESRPPAPDSKPALPEPRPPAPAPKPDPYEAIKRTLQQYVAAFEARSLPALRQIWPGLGGPQERAIRAEFENARQITVSFDSPTIQLSGETATVVSTRRYALSTHDGHDLRSDARSTFQLRSVDGRWVIESVRFEAR